MARKLVIASNNRHKLEELVQMVASARSPQVRALEVLSIGALGERLGPAPEIEESADTFAGNALLKANGIAAWMRSHGAEPHDMVLADDSGLCVAAFDGAPGVYSARFAGTSGPGTDEANNRKLVTELQARGLDRSPAEYVCVLALRFVGTRPFDFTLPESGTVYMRDGCLCLEGRAPGQVRIERRGQGGFGYDPHFWVDDGARTYAELSMADKARRSHRGAAMRKLIDELPLMLA